MITLICNGNDITELPTLPKSLKVLVCNDTELTSLPNNILDFEFTEFSFINTPIYRLIMEKHSGVIEFYLKRKKKTRFRVRLSSIGQCTSIALSLAF